MIETHLGPRPSSVRGFTIVELMITVAVAAILLGVAVPSFTGLVVNSRLTTQTHDVIAAMNLARSEAIKRNSAVAFCRVASASATACGSSNGEWQHWIVRASNGTIVRRGRINTYGNTLRVSSTLLADRVDFGSDGLARSSGVLANGRQFSVCASNGRVSNIKRVTLGAGSRLSTDTATGSC